MNENISSSNTENTTNRVRFDDNIIIIEYNAKERIYKKRSVASKILKFILSIWNNS